MSLSWHTFLVLWAAGASECVLITQWPPHVVSRLDTSVELNCYQNDTEYQYLYWYKQQKGGRVQVMGSVVAGTAEFEEEYKSGGYEAARPSRKRWTLTIARVQERDAARYLCAARFAQCGVEPRDCDKNTPRTNPQEATPGSVG